MRGLVLSLVAAVAVMGNGLAFANHHEEHQHGAAPEAQAVKACPHHKDGEASDKKCCCCKHKDEHKEGAEKHEADKAH